MFVRGRLGVFVRVQSDKREVYSVSALSVRNVFSLIAMIVQFNTLESWVFVL